MSLALQLVSSSIVQRSAAMFAVRVVGVGLSFLVSIFFARAIGVEQYGLYVFWTTAAGMAATFLSLGTPTVVMREVAATRGSEDHEKRERVIGFGLLVTGAIVLLLTTGGFLAATFDSSTTGFAFWRAPPFLAFLATAAAAAGAFSVSILLGFERVLISQLIGLVTPIITAAGGYFLWVCEEGTAYASHAISVTVLAAVLGALVSTIVLVRCVDPADRTPSSIRAALSSAAPWLTLGVLLAINQVLVNAITQIDILMLGWLATPDATANYHVASRISYVAAFFFGSVTAIIAPTIARLHDSKRGPELARTLQHASIIAFAGTAVSSIVVITLGKQIILLFGSDFAGAENTMRILVLTWILHAAFGLNHTTLAMAGAAKIAVLGLAAAAILNIGLNLIMVPLWAAQGAALASLVSTLGFTIGFWAIVRHRYRFSLDIALASIQSIPRKDRKG